MKLKALLAGIDYVVLQNSDQMETREILRVVRDSRNVEEGDAFVCIKGTRADGHSFIWEVYEKNVSVFIVEKNIVKGTFLEFPRQAIVIQVLNTREAYAFMAANFWGHPADAMTLVGITGTKGKTTVSIMVKTLLEAQGERVGVIGTFGIYDGEEWVSTKNTTPDAFTIHEYFGKMKDKGCNYVVMEVSSQGIKQQRICGLQFEVAVFTNLGEDHIGPEEHHSFEEYRYYKSRLFAQCRKGICNLDDLSSSYMFRRRRCEKYGFTCQREFCCMKQIESERVLRADKIECIWENGRPSTQFVIENESYFLQLPGLFNVYNALAALAVMRCLSYDIRTMKKELSDVLINGRMEMISNDKSVACYIDYAHNGLSLKEALTTLRTYEPGKIILVFGCGGNRAKSRRLEMGRAAAAFADYVIVTTDNPRYEDPEKIAEEIVEGFDREESVNTNPDKKAFYEIILDRKEAVLRAVEIAAEKDIVVIAGKGHEQYQEIEGIRYRMDDHELLQEALLKKSRGSEEQDRQSEEEERVEETECMQM